VTTNTGISLFAHRMNIGIEWLVSYVAGILFFGVTVFTMIEIVRRYVFGTVFEWGQDASIYFMVVAVALYFCVTQIRRGHLVMAAIIEYLNHKKFYRVVGLSRILATIATAALCLSLSVSGWEMVSYSYSMNVTSTSLAFDLWMFHVMFVISMGLMGLVALFQIIEDVIAYANGEHLLGQVDLIADI